MNTLEIEFRAEVTGDTISGHAAVFGQFARVGGHLETIAPGAFDRAIRERHDVRLTVGHDQNKVLARTKSGTLDIWADEVGLAFSAKLPNTSLANDVRESLARGDLDSMSFAFMPTADVWSQRDGKQVQTVTDLDLIDVSIVGLPAYSGTDVRLRAFDTYTDPSQGHPRLTLAKSRLLITGA